MRKHSAFPITLALLSTILVASSPLQAQVKTVDLLQSFDSAKQSVRGSWNRSKTELNVQADKAAICNLIDDVPSNYRLSIEFTRTTGNDVVAVILPVGNTSVALELSSWSGEAHGLARVNGQTSRSATNPTSVQPGKLENGKRQRVDVAVTQAKTQATITVQLNGKQLIAWKGPTSQLQSHLVFKLPSNRSLGLATMKGNVVFHNISLVGVDETESPKPTPNPKPIPSSNTKTANRVINLATLSSTNTPGWEPFNGGRFTTTKSDGRAAIAAMPNAGSGDRGAYLKDVTFSQGSIEVELKGSAQRGQSFVGIAFHGVDGETYDAVYFRPFNFKASNSVNRSHSVQYIAHPDWPWQRLRNERNGQFEKQASPEPNSDQWFKARIEVDGNSVRVFVNDGKTPCLDVKKLNTRKTGKVGLWFNGVASFANLKVTAKN